MTMPVLTGTLFSLVRDAPRRRPHDTTMPVLTGILSSLVSDAPRRRPHDTTMPVLTEPLIARARRSTPATARHDDARARRTAHRSCTGHPRPATASHADAGPRP